MLLKICSEDCLVDHAVIVALKLFSQEWLEDHAVIVTLCKMHIILFVQDYESDFEDSVDSDTSDEGADIRNDDSTESELVELTPRHHPFVEEEKKLDSGNYDLADRRQKTREIQELKNALERENEALSAQG